MVNKDLVYILQISVFANYRALPKGAGMLIAELLGDSSQARHHLTTHGPQQKTQIIFTLGGDTSSLPFSLQTRGGFSDCKDSEGRGPGATELGVFCGSYVRKHSPLGCLVP